MTCSLHSGKKNNIPILLGQNLEKVEYRIKSDTNMHWPTWKTVTVAQRRESKFFLSQTPVSGSQNLQPNKFIPSILKVSLLSINFANIYIPEDEDEKG